MTKIIKNDSKGYGYNYASLCDIASQGVEIPLMKTGTEPINGKDYIYYFDTNSNEWLRGAEIVVPESKSQNKAQMYASGVTYARRVTVQLAMSIATTDDDVIENTNGDGSEKNADTGEPITPKQLEFIEKLPIEQIAKVLRYYQVERTRDLTKAQAIDCINKLRGK